MNQLTTDRTRELLLNFQILLVNSITARMRYIFTEEINAKEFKILVYYFSEPLPIDNELIDEVAENIIANTTSYVKYSYEYIVDGTTSYEFIRRLSNPVFGRHENA